MHGMKCMEYACFMRCFSSRARYGINIRTLAVLPYSECDMEICCYNIIMHVDQLFYNCYANLTSAVFYVCELPMDPPCAFGSVHLVGLQSARS